jgi:hypothetical protein
MDINAQSILSTFHKLEKYIIEEFEPKILLFASDTLLLNAVIKKEFERRCLVRKPLDEMHNNETIINHVQVWFRKFLIMNQLCHLLYYGTATTDEEKSFFKLNFHSPDFNSIVHPTAKKVFDLNFKHNEDKGEEEAAAILFNKKFENPKSDNDDSEFDLCCFCVAFFTDDLYIKSEEEEGEYIVLSSRNLPTVNVQISKVRINLFFI